MTVNPFYEWREQGAWEWAFWKLIQSPYETFFMSPPPYPTTEIPDELKEVVKPDWAVLKGEKKEGRLNYTWVSRGSGAV